MRLEPGLQAQALSTRKISPLPNLAAIPGDSGKKLPSADSSVQISDAARRRLGAEQAGGAPDNLPTGVKHMLEDIVDHPELGVDLSTAYATGVHTAAMSLDDYLAGKNTLEAGIGELSAVWAGIQGGQGTPAEKYAQLLKHELSMSSQYWDAQGGSGAVATPHELAQAKLDYLQHYMAGR